MEGFRVEVIDAGITLVTLAAATAITRAIVRHPAFGVGLTKRVMRGNLDAPSLARAVLTENHTQVLCTTTAGFVEGVSSLIGRPSRDGVPQP